MREHKIVLVLFLVSMLAVALLTRTTPTSAHEFSRLGTVESLVERGTFQLDDSIFIVTVDKIQRGGHYYSHQPPLLSILEAPIYWGLHLTGMRFNNSGRLLITYLFSLLTNGVAFAITVVLLYRILELTGVERRLGARTLELVGALVEHRHVGRVHARHDALGGEAGPGARVEHRQPLLEPTRIQRQRAHRGRPEERVDPAVVPQGEEPVEPEGLAFVLDQPHWMGTIR